MRRTKRYNTRLTESEYSKFIEDSKKYGYKNLADFGRYKLLIDLDNNIDKLQYSNDISQEIKLFNYHLNKIGNNINQIAKAVNRNDITLKLAIEDVNNKMNFLYDLALKINEKIR